MPELRGHRHSPDVEAAERNMGSDIVPDPDPDLFVSIYNETAPELLLSGYRISLLIGACILIPRI